MMMKILFVEQELWNVTNIFSADWSQKRRNKDADDLHFLVGWRNNVQYIRGVRSSFDSNGVELNWIGHINGFVWERFSMKVGWVWHISVQIEDPNNEKIPFDEGKGPTGDEHRSFAREDLWTPSSRIKSIELKEKKDACSNLQSLIGSFRRRCDGNEQFSS